MIKSFLDRHTEAVFNRKSTKRFGADVQRLARRKLLLIDAAVVLDTLRIPPGNKLEALERERFGQHSIRINDQWRICFAWNEGDAFEVEITDYHKG